MKELDEEMKQLRKAYSLHSNSVSSEGSFRSLVQNSRSDSSDKRVASRILIQGLKNPRKQVKRTKC